MCGKDNGLFGFQIFSQPMVQTLAVGTIQALMWLIEKNEVGFFDQGACYQGSTVSWRGSSATRQPVPRARCGVRASSAVATVIDTSRHTKSAKALSISGAENASMVS